MFLIDPGPKLQPTFFQFKEEHCLVLDDYYSDSIEFDKMRNKLQINHFSAIKKSSHDGDFLMRLSLTVEGILIVRNSTILSGEADKTHDILTQPSSE